MTSPPKNCTLMRFTTPRLHTLVSKPGVVKHVEELRVLGGDVMYADILLTVQ